MVAVGKTTSPVAVNGPAAIDGGITCQIGSTVLEYDPELEDALEEPCR